MSECEKIQELICQMPDNGLSEAEAAAVDEHIAGCEECALMYESFAAIRRELSDCEVPADLHEKIMDRVNAAARAAKASETMSSMSKSSRCSSRSMVR